MLIWHTFSTLTIYRFSKSKDIFKYFTLWNKNHILLLIVFLMFEMNQKIPVSILCYFIKIVFFCESSFMDDTVLVLWDKKYENLIKNLHTCSTIFF